MAVKVFCDADDCGEEILPESHHFIAYAGMDMMGTHQAHFHELCFDGNVIEQLLNDTSHTPLNWVRIEKHNFPTQEADNGS